MKRISIALLLLLLAVPSWARMGVMMIGGGVASGGATAYAVNQDQYNTEESPYGTSDSLCQTFLAEASGGILSAKIMSGTTIGAASFTARLAESCDASSSYISESTNSVTPDAANTEYTFNFSSGSITNGETYAIVIMSNAVLYSNRTGIAMHFTSTSANQVYADGVAYKGDAWVATTTLSNYRDFYLIVTVSK